MCLCGHPVADAWCICNGLTCVGMFRSVWLMFIWVGIQMGRTGQKIIRERMSMDVCDYGAMHRDVTHAFAAAIELEQTILEHTHTHRVLCHVDSMRKRSCYETLSKLHSPTMVGIASECIRTSAHVLYMCHASTCFSRTSNAIGTRHYCGLYAIYVALPERLPWHSAIARNAIGPNTKSCRTLRLAHRL